MRLYELPVEAERIEAQLSESGGELTPELETRIAEFIVAGKEKLEAAAMVVKHIEADATACKTEADRLYGRQAGLVKSVARLKALMLIAVDEVFSGKVKTARFTIYGQTSPSTVAYSLKPDADIYELAASNPEFIRMGLPELKVSELHDARKAGVALPDSIIVDEQSGKRSLRIK